MITRGEITPVGKVVKTHGVDGEMSVKFDIDSFDESVVPGACLIFDIDGIFVPFFVGSVRSRGNESLLVRLDGEESQEQASAFVGRDVYMLADEVDDADEAPDGQLYASDLIGFAAALSDGRVIGEIDDYDDSTDNPLFHVRDTAGKLILIPIVDDFIEEIDAEGNTVFFDLPDGLLEL